MVPLGLIDGGTVTTHTIYENSLTHFQKYRQPKSFWDIVFEVETLKHVANNPTEGGVGFVISYLCLLACYTCLPAVIAYGVVDMTFKYSRWQVNWLCLNTTEHKNKALEFVYVFSRTSEMEQRLK